MIRFSLLIGAAALTLAGAASAQGYGYQSNDDAYRNYTQNYQPRNTACEKQRDNDKLAGGLVGAVAGGLIGGAIGNNIDTDNHHRGRYGRYGNGYGNYGRGYGRRNHRRYDRRRNHNSDNDGDVIVGALLGAIVGGIAGSSLAESSSNKCESYGPQRTTNYGGYSNNTRNNNYGRTTYPASRGTDYGRREVYGGTAPSYPPARTYPTSTRTYPATTTSPRQPAYGGRECQTVYRETRLPSGEVIRDPVEVCRDNASSDWRVTGSAAGSGY